MQQRKSKQMIRVQPGSPFGLPAPYPPPGAFTRPLPDSYRSKNQLKITFLVKKSKKDQISYHNESNQKFSPLLTVFLPMKIHCKKYLHDRTMTFQIQKFLSQTLEHSEEKEHSH